MITLSKEQYRDKVRGCFMGKNIGGTLGAPFEAVRYAADIDFYTTDLADGALPNDDLDLQLAWLCAAERYGRAVNADILSEYWISAIMPNWAEYGVGKSNLRFGLPAPVSGGHENAFKDSNGAWIRSELWACLMPGHPELAVKYAYEDACVDHADEGVYAEVFTAALESAAFVESDLYKLIDIGLSYIPEGCEVARAVKLVIDCYKKKMTWKEARRVLLTEVPDSFGCQYRAENKEGLPQGAWGMDAPSNIGISVIGWLWGEGDFGKSICIAAGCGEDGDCTTATLGSILGIIRGADALPEKWVKPVGDEIKTCSINLKCDLVKVPETITELTERVCNLMPIFMNGNFSLFDTGREIRMLDADDLSDTARDRWMITPYNFKDKYPESYRVYRGSNAVMNVDATLDDLYVRTGETRRVKIHAENVAGFVGSQLWLEFRWLLPEGWTVDTGARSALFLNQYHCGEGNAWCEANITAGTFTAPTETVVLEVTAHDRPCKLYIPITFICK